MKMKFDAGSLFCRMEKFSFMTIPMMFIFFINLLRVSSRSGASCFFGSGSTAPGFFEPKASCILKWLWTQDLKSGLVLYESKKENKIDKTATENKSFLLPPGLDLTLAP